MADIHKEYDPPTEKEIEMMGKRMSAYIFPNTPRTEEEHRAFDEAVLYQIEHEKTLQEVLGQEMESIPDGTTSFTIGTFSMSFKDGFNQSTLNKETICSYAYSVLLRAGLLYKGVRGGCCGCL